MGIGVPMIRCRPERVIRDAIKRVIHAVAENLKGSLGWIHHQVHITKDYIVRILAEFNQNLARLRASMTWDSTLPGQ